MSGLFGGGGSSSSSQAANSTTVNVATNFSVDTTGLQKAIDALTGVTSSSQGAVAGALTTNGLTMAAALAGLGKSLEKGLSAVSEQGGKNTALIVALIGFAGVLVAARVIKLKGIKL